MTNAHKAFRAQLKAALAEHRKQRDSYAARVERYAEVAQDGGTNAEWLAMHERMIAEIEAKLAEMAGK